MGDAPGQANRRKCSAPIIFNIVGPVYVLTMTIVFRCFFKEELENDGNFALAKPAVQWLQIAQIFTALHELAIFFIFAPRLGDSKEKERYLRYRATGAILCSIVLITLASWAAYMLYSCSNGVSSSMAY